MVLNIQLIKVNEMSGAIALLSSSWVPTASPRVTLTPQELCVADSGKPWPCGFHGDSSLDHLFLLLRQWDIHLGRACLGVVIPVLFWLIV